MKKSVITFLSLLFVSSTLFLSCQDDDNEDTTPTEQVTTVKQYKDVEASNTNINTIVEDVFNAESGLIGNRNFESKMPDCVTVSSESTDTIRTIIIDFGDSCGTNGEIISGIIRMSFSTLLDADNKIEISYSLENFKYKDISVNGSATTVFSFQRETGNNTFTTNSNFTFIWDDGLSATSETDFVNETFFEMNPDTPGDFDYYSLTSGNSNTTFSNGDKYAVEITTPLRNERSCGYTVSGVIVTTENSDTTTLDYGNGECDNIATQTDKDGNETTIEL